MPHARYTGPRAGSCARAERALRTGPRIRAPLRKRAGGWLPEPHSGQDEAAAGQCGQLRAVDAQVLMGYLVFEPLEEEAKCGLQQLDREPFARTTVPRTMIAAALWDERKRVRVPAREPL